MIDIPDTSRAAVISKHEEPLEVWELPIPKLEPGSMLVRIDAATICGSDVHVWDGSLNAIRPIDLPVVPGHEMAGTIVAMPDGESRVDSVGQPLAPGVPIVFTLGRCGECHHCSVTRMPSLCENRKPYGTNCEAFPYLVGSFAEYCYVYPSSRAVRVPANVKPEWASAASCALRTVVGAFDRLGPIEPWETIVIQGAGPLGLFATAMAERAGAGRIIVIGDPAPRLDLARDWGAHDTIAVGDAPEAQTRVDAVRGMTNGKGAEVVMELSGAPTAFAEGLEMARRGGRYVVVGQVGPREVPVRASAIVKGHLNILGSFSGSESEYWRALQFMSRTQDRFDFDRILTNRYGLDDVTTALRRMQSGEEIKPVIVPSAT